MTKQGSVKKKGYYVTGASSTTVLPDYGDDAIIDVESASYSDNASPSDTPLSDENSALLWALTAFYFINLAIAIVFNAATFTQLMAKRNKHIHFVTNPYVLCLLVTNVLWPVINIPFNVVQIWTPYWHFGRLMCKVFPVIQMCFPDTISLTLCLIAVERYISVVHPFKTNPLLKQNIALIALSLIWLTPLGLNLVLAISHDQVKFDDANFVCTVTTGDNMSSRFIESYKVLQAFLVLLIIPGVLFPFCYGKIIFKVFAMKSPAEKLSITKQSSDKSPKRLPVIATRMKRRLPSIERRKHTVALLAIAIQVVHFVCWTPIVIFQLVHFCRRYPPLAQGELTVLRFFILLASANPTFNSLLYTAALYRERSNDKSRQAGNVAKISKAKAEPENELTGNNFPPGQKGDGEVFVEAKDGSMPVMASSNVTVLLNDGMVKRILNNPILEPIYEWPDDCMEESSEIIRNGPSFVDGDHKNYFFGEDGGNVAEEDEAEAPEQQLLKVSSQEIQIGAGTESPLPFELEMVGNLNSGDAISNNESVYDNMSSDDAPVTDG